MSCYNFMKRLGFFRVCCLGVKTSATLTLLADINQPIEIIIIWLLNHAAPMVSMKAVYYESRRDANMTESKQR